MKAFDHQEFQTTLLNEILADVKIVATKSFIE